MKSACERGRVARLRIMHLSKCYCHIQPHRHITTQVLKHTLPHIIHHSKHNSTTKSNKQNKLVSISIFLFFKNLPFQSKGIRPIKHNSTSLTSNKFLLFHSVQNRNANGSRKDSLASITLLAISTMPIFILI